VVQTATKVFYFAGFAGTCETVGQVLKFVWRLCSKINVVCMSLSPFDSFQSRFVNYLLNRPPINGHGVLISFRPFSDEFFSLSVPFMFSNNSSNKSRGK